MTPPEPPTSAQTAEFCEALLARFGLTPAQTAAARERRRNVAVTAGAGSGKTRTLVARYLPLLAELRSPRRIAAITFTEKAAREMRNRIREEVRKLIQTEEQAQARAAWVELEAQLDAARIGTIHSLCQEILRAHPVESGMDPQFAVIDEGQGAVLLAQAARAALVETIDLAEFQPLFAFWKTGTLETLLQNLVRRRLDLDEALAAGLAHPTGPRRALQRWLGASEAQAALAELHSWKANGTLHAAAAAGDKLAPLALDLITDLEQASAFLQKGETALAALALFTARREHMSGRYGRSGPLKELVKSLREAYDDRLGWLGGAKTSDAPPDVALEAQTAAVMALLVALYQRARQRYLAELRRRGAIDFDDLEGTALALLSRAHIAAHWQSEIHAVLVDEFQDTNARQRTIVQALCGTQPGKLFVVGDARQSIYRFRGANVAVFLNLQNEIRAQQGLYLDLDLTFRAHAGLLAASANLLAPIMGSQSDPARPYQIPFTPLNAHRPAPRAGCLAPHAVFVLGGGEDADAGRSAAAQVLCQHLLELRQAGQIGAWDEVALLFRASTGFPAYEDALEAHGIPYVTVAGRGFYDRPEIRDLLNLLQALADPWDDLALSGLLCSPAFHLSAVGLVRLRWQPAPGELAEPGSQKTALYQALRGDLSRLSEADHQAAQFARDFLDTLTPWVDRIPVAELLERMVAFTDYRAILAGDASRRWRNLDKLLADARASGVTQVRAFLEYLGLLRDVGAREGESAVESEGAVRLMTIHKSKGLEFEFVVLADAARQGLNRSEQFYLLPEAGLAAKPDLVEGEPLAYRYARAEDKDQSEAEACRLLYVALTRAKEKLLISGHLTHKESGPDARGWLKDLLAAAGMSLAGLDAAVKSTQVLPLACGQSAALIYAPAACLPVAPAAQNAPPGSTPAENRISIYAPLAAVALPPLDEEDIPSNDWRVSGQAQVLIGKAIGQIVHHCLRRWRFPDSSSFETFVKALLQEQGLFEPQQFHTVRQEAEKLLARFRAHPLWQELDQAAVRRHELPYSQLRRDGRVETGYLDVLYRRPDQAGWLIVDFKSDTVQSAAELETLVERYTPQLRRYTYAVDHLLGPVDGASLCFLDDRGAVTLREI